MLELSEYKPPFPWFGGKRRVAGEIWRALGDVVHYVEPFAGSLATLFLRPREHEGYIETVNDYDMYIANFWRALQGDPEQVAHYADNPVNEADLTARHIWLVNSGRERILRIQGDPDYYDAKVAGWWVWGLSAWIGGGWCSGRGPWTAEDGRLTRRGAHEPGAKRQRPHLGDAGRGVNRKRAGEAGGVNTGLDALTGYMRTLAERLRYVRVCNGDWSRVVTMGALSCGATVGVFLDPPYDTNMRDAGLYNTDRGDDGISARVRAWCLENGDNPRYRIVLAGYEGEHDLPATWRVHQWKAGAPYQRALGGSANEENRAKERLWFSPHCLRPRGNQQRTMFDTEGIWT